MIQRFELGHCNGLAMTFDDEFEFRGYLILQIIKQVSLFGQIAQWLERVHGKDEDMGSIS